jgi:protein arginine kinase activator
MLCQNCQKRIANVHFTQVINGERIELYLCEKCANEKSQSSFGAPLGINDFFSGLIGFGAPPQYVSAPPEQAVCKQCGMSYEDFLKTGKMGCGNCYEVFGERLQPIFRKLHGAQEHAGKMPQRQCKGISSSKELQKLKEMLNKAIQQEEYEKAAELRDKIRQLEVE